MTTEPVDEPMTGGNKVYEDVLEEKSTDPVDYKALSEKNYGEMLRIKKDYAEMLMRMKQELTQRDMRIQYLEPRVQAYEAMLLVINKLDRPPVSNGAMGENILWMLDKKLRQLTSPVAEDGVHGGYARIGDSILGAGKPKGASE